MSLLERHERTVREQRGYDAVAGPIGDLPASYCRQRFAFASSADALAAATPAETLLSVGISPTGPPHVGTLGQIQSAIDFQRAGFDVQVLVADQVVYNARGTPMGTLTERAERYAAFARERGFDPGAGRLLIQSETPSILRTAFTLAPAYDPDGDGDEESDGDAGGHEPTAFETALDAAYDDADLPDGAPAFSQQLCGLLLAADAVSPLRDGSYDRVVLVLGADNVGFERNVDAVREAAGIDGSVEGLYTRLVAGVDDTPKMSKSIPGSSIHLGMAPGEIRDLVRDPTLDAADPDESVVFQMLRHASPHAGAELADLRDACAADSEQWRDAISGYVDYLTEAAKQWQATAR